MFIVTAVCALLILLSARRPKRSLAVALIGSVALLTVAPQPAEAQLPCLPCAIQTVIDTINNKLGGALNALNNIRSDVMNLYRQTVWPLALIQQARSQIAGTISKYRGLLQGLMSINPHTATLPNAAALENIIRDRSTGNLGSVSPMYAAAYGSVPTARNLSPAARNMVDMDDALAQNSLKTAKMSDQAQDLMQQAADQIESMAASSAPGSAPFLTASAAVANIKSQALMQKMLAAMLRQDAAKAAHDNALRKSGSTVGVQLQNDIGKMLQHR